MQSQQKKPFGRATIGSPPTTAHASDPVYMYDRREHPRSHVLQAAKLVFGASEFGIDCFIHDISFSGARVRVQRGPTIPDTIILVHLRDRVAYEASVVWRKDDGTLGLKFLARHDLEQAATPGLKALRRHCVEYSLR